MNVNSATQLLQTGFRTALGASSAIAELLHNPQKLVDILAQPPRSPDRLLQDLATRGESIEQEAHKFGETFLSGGSNHSKPPQYIERANEQCFLQPYDIKGTNLYGFVLEGSLPQLQNLCDKYLNNLTSGQIEYRPATHYILLTFGSIDSLASREKPDRDRGYIDEQEVVIWVLTAVGQQRGSIFQINRFAWFVPYIFVSNSPALASGREVYGIPKEIASFNIPSIDRLQDPFSLHTYTWKTLTAQTEAKWEQLIKVSQKNGGSESQPPKIWTSYSEAVAEIAQLFFGSDSIMKIPGLSLPLNLLEYLLQYRLNAEIPVVMLKQFRDEKDGKQACYQAIVEIPMKVSKYHAGRLLSFGSTRGSQYEVTIYNFASHPIVTELGLQKGKPEPEQPVNIQPNLAFWLNFDFTVENGTAVWKAHS
ncbi:hypothetical protein [Microcoleus asticus]|uniref:Uncharacterized protein n=1 Tax=Microcoleus asticus IPMA8 TaxID=2563858 RepID=A0ABX2D1S4_9CYAN|nr:hypothetical protein [Microcoleus asticus]NQE35803.1 hypothetical protein [Microcoleus asticus IPMA8]